MTTTRIDGKFYPLQESEWVNLIKKLNYSEIKVLYYLRSIDPFGDRFKEFHTKGVAKTLELSIRSVQRALNKLAELELIDREIATFHNIVRATRTVVESTINTASPTAPPSHSDRQLVTEDEPGTPRSPHQADYATPIKTFHTNPDQDDKINNLTPNSTPEEPQHIIPSPWEQDEPDPNQRTEDMGEDRGSGAIVKSCNKSIDKTDNLVLKTKPRPRKKQDIYDWVPEGPWNINGKLDEKFVEAIALSWVKEFGGEIYKRRADVIAYFYKNPALLPARWEQYSAEYLDRYKVAQRTMASGGKIESDYQKRLVDNHRAISNPLPEELKPVATEPHSSVISHPHSRTSQSSVISGQETLDADFWLEEDPGESDIRAIAEESSVIADEKNGIADEKNAIAKDAPSVSADNSSLVTDDCSLVTENNAPENAENPQAYQKWKQPDYLNDPEYQPSPEKQAFIKNAIEEFTKNHSMPPRDKSLREPPKTRIEEINQRLEDPILRKEIMPRLKKDLDMYEWIPDEYGNPIKIIDYRF